MLHFFYEIADNILKDCISEETIFHNHKCLIKISILMMNFHFHIFEAIYKLQLAIKCCKINIYKMLISVSHQLAYIFYFRPFTLHWDGHCLLSSLSQ